jgi:hypothetical protein
MDPGTLLMGTSHRDFPTRIPSMRLSLRTTLSCGCFVVSLGACSGSAITDWPNKDGGSATTPTVDATSEMAPWMLPTDDSGSGSSSGGSGSSNSSGSGSSSGAGSGSGGGSGGGMCGACTADSDCTAGCASPAAGYVWCCGNSTCYTWQAACPAGSSSGSGGGSGSGSGGSSGGGSGSGSGGGSGSSSGSANCGAAGGTCCVTHPRCISRMTCVNNKCP